MAGAGWRSSVNPSEDRDATLERIFGILGWYFLGRDAVASVERALDSGYVHLGAGDAATVF